MNGLEAIELMKQGKMIKSGIWIYSMDSVGGIWIRNKSCAIWAEAEMFNILANDYEEYVEPKPLTGWERAKEGQRFNVICSDDIVKLWEAIDSECERLHDEANYFSTKEKAEEIDFKQTLFRKLQRFSDENGGNEIDWKGKPQNKYAVLYSHVNRKFIVTSCWQSQNFGQVYFISEEVANKAIELFHDDLIKYFTGDFGGEA